MRGAVMTRKPIGPRMVWTGLLMLGLAGCMSLSRLKDETLQTTAIISDPLEAHWSSTTLEAASTPQHRKILEHGHVETITGEVVDISCFLQLGKRGEAHIACGQKCVRNGQPVGVLTDKGRLYFVMPEEHHPRRDGQVSVKDRFADLMGKRIKISGMVTKYNDILAMFVTSPPAPVAAEPQPAQ